MAREGRLVSSPRQVTCRAWSQGGWRDDQWPLGGMRGPATSAQPPSKMAPGENKGEDSSGVSRGLGFKVTAIWVTKET